MRGVLVGRLLILDRRLGEAVVFTQPQQIGHRQIGQSRSQRQHRRGSREVRGHVVQNVVPFGDRPVQPQATHVVQRDPALAGQNTLGEGLLDHIVPLRRLMEEAVPDRRGAATLGAAGDLSLDPSDTDGRASPRNGRRDVEIDRRHRGSGHHRSSVM